MQRPAIAFALLVWLGLALASAAAEPRENFLGKTAGQWAGELKSDVAAERHLAAWSLAQMGPAAEDSLTAALAHDDPTVRFWAVAGLARIATADPPDPPRVRQTVDRLAPRLKDRSPAVRIAAAETLIRLDRHDAGLEVLTASLADPQEAVRIQTIDSLEKLGPLALPAKAEIEKATGDNSEYVKRISSRLLKTLGNTP